MKKRMISLFVVVTIIIVIFSNIAMNKQKSEDFKPLELNVGNEFTSISYPNKMYVLNYVVGDFIGNNVKNMMIVIGEKENVQDTWSENIDIVLYDTNKNEFIKGNIKNFSGNSPKLIVGDFTGDTKLDLFAFVEDEGEIQARAVSYENENLNEIFKLKNNTGIAFNCKFLDGFKAQIDSRKYNRQFTVDLSDRKENYITKGLYDEAGRLFNTEAKIKAGKIELIESVQLNDRMGIRTIQKIRGIDNYDMIDEIEVIYKFEDNKWDVKDARGLKIGNILY